MGEPKNHPNKTRTEIDEFKELVSRKIFGDAVYKTRKSEVELLRRKMLSAMETAGEMGFFDIELDMLKASLTDGLRSLGANAGYSPIMRRWDENEEPEA